MTGCLKRLHFTSANEVIGVGSLGQIVRSTDGGLTWVCVRSTGFRTGLLNMITDADKAAWHLLSHVAAEQGVRSAIIQISQPLSLEGNALMDGVPMSDRAHQLSLDSGATLQSRTGCFLAPNPNTIGRQNSSSPNGIDKLDGRLRKLLPLRIARDIRNWRPSVVVIEPVSDEDAVAAILRDVMPQALSLAASDVDGRSLSQLDFRRAWTVLSVCVPQDQSATITFRNDDLLPSLGTTSGLLRTMRP